MRVNTLNDPPGEAVAKTAAGSDPGLTIDELARSTDLVVSTVRLYQNKGLVAPPVRRGRVGFYGRHHVERLRAIAELQARGFSLAGIKELFDALATGDSLRSALGLEQLTSVWAAEQSEPMSLADLAGRLPSVEFTPEVVQRVIALGLVEFSPDGTSVVVKSPSFLSIGSQLAAMGVTVAEILDEYELLRAQTDEIAQRFTELFRRRMWKPFVKRGMPPDDLAPLLRTLEKLAPLAESVTEMALRHSLQHAADAFMRAEARRLGTAIERPAPA
jgi:DNA-binding transcriptional MerR regulator